MSEYVDWEDLSQEDQENAERLLQELNEIMDKYTKKDEVCEDSTLGD